MLSPSQVVPFLQHEDQRVRNLSVKYLCGANDPSPATADDIWRMIDKHGTGEHAYLGYGALKHLPQSETSLNRMLAELTKQTDSLSLGAMEDAIAKLQYGILIRFRDTIEQAPGLSDALRGHLQQRFELAGMTTAELTDRLDAYAKEVSKSDQGYEKVDKRISWRFTEALARNPESAHWAITTVNDETVDDYRELFAIELLGKLRNRSFAEVIFNRFASAHEDDDALREVASEALRRIGGVQLVQLARSRFSSIDRLDHDYIVKVISANKIPQAEAALNELLAGEADLTTRASLATGLCEIAATVPSALEQLRMMMKSGKWDMQLFELDDDVVALFTMVGFNIPELDDWRRGRLTQQQRRQRRSDWYDRMKAAKPVAPVRPIGSDAPIESDDFAWDLDDEIPEAPVVRPELSAPQVPTTVRPIRRPVGKVGRNDPCPCGSGKKYKKCCGK